MCRGSQFSLNEPFCPFGDTRPCAEFQRHLAGFTTSEKLVRPA